MLAAIQAPVIIMSQNRQAANDRAHAEHDYEVNLKAELEIMSLHEKIDTLREKQWTGTIGNAAGADSYAQSVRSKLYRQQNRNNDRTERYNIKQSCPNDLSVKL